MDLGRPLTVVTPTVDADVLAVLANAKRAFSGREVHRVVGRHSERGIRNVLDRLSDQGIVTRERVGAANLYALNRRHLAASHIEALAQLRAELFQRITQEVESWKSPAEYIAIFGSAARGDMRPDSDIDLLIVRPDPIDADDEPWQQQLEQLTQHVTEWTGNDTRSLEFSASEVTAGLAAGQRILDEIRADGIVLLGPRSYLRKPKRNPDQHGGMAHG